ncbi:amino acid ABC transporter substrate-binding protein [Falsibacillus albus]|uniref:Amino acid ABC transporter substrate-binding protein n=1 Tax=Falsibacillus albus TaxID=2478915 RepID=A0A3L7K4Z7_9BACI|nr:amino acid ABC transporter substrate-binding protein [Falsibacillus albus]RLQ97334.1 amino acid ABC transporter substrate-binding protein [Falsibacillus albus]
MKGLKLFLVLALSAIFMLAGCGSKDQSAKNGSLYDKIKKDGVLTIGTEGTYAPFTFHDKSGKLTGFDVELAREVAKRLGVKAEFKETQWDSMFGGLNSKRFDMIANEVGIRPDRQKKYDFSDPYIKSAAVLVTAKDNDKVKSFDDMKGLTAAQSLTSNYRDIAEKNGAKIMGVEGLSQSIKLIEQGRADVTVNDKLSILDYLNNKKNANIKIAATAKDAASSAFMFRKGNDKLVKEVNKALKDMKEDGTYLKISKKWFGEDVSK